MFTINSDPFASVEISPAETPTSVGWPYEELYNGLARRNYPKIYAELRKLTILIPPEIAAALCQQALQCTPRVFEQLLEFCPPPRELTLFDPDVSTFRGSTLGANYSLEALAAYLGNPKHLQLLIDRDADINFHTPTALSPLEAALAGRSLRCIELLTRNPSLRQPLTPYILSEWAGAEMDDVMLTFCIQTLQDYFFPEAEHALDATILPPQMSLSLLFRHRNWGMIRRLCESETIDKCEAAKAMQSLFLCHFQTPQERQELVSLVDALFTACPALLKCTHPRSLLTALILDPSFETEALRPHAEALSGRIVILRPCGARWTGSHGLLRHWEACFGVRLRPAVNRNKPLPDTLDFFEMLANTKATCSDIHDDALYDVYGQSTVDTGSNEFFRLCHFSGPRPNKGLSLLAEQALSTAAPSTLLYMMQRGDSLSTERQENMLRFLPNADIPAANRALILSQLQATEEHRAALYAL